MDFVVFFKGEKITLKMADGCISTGYFHVVWDLPK